MYIAMFLTMFLLGATAVPTDEMQQMQQLVFSVYREHGVFFNRLSTGSGIDDDWLRDYVLQNEHGEFILNRLASLHAANAGCRDELTVVQANLAKATATLGDHNELKTRYNELVTDDGSCTACADDPNFAYALGGPCTDWDSAHRAGKTCAEAGTALGYTTDQVDKVVAACPQTCGGCT